MTRLYVVMPVHGQWDLAKAACETLADSADEAKDVSATLHIINTAGPPAPEDVRDMLGRKWTPDVVLTTQSVNHGVTQAWNMGIEDGLDAGADVVCVTNSDLVFGRSVVQRCVDAALKYGAALPRRGKAGPLPADFWEQDARISAEPDAVEGGWEGFCFFLSRALLEKVGLFDEQFTLWYQDTAYVPRMERAGYCPQRVLNCLVHHYESRTICAMPGGFNMFGWRKQDAMRYEAWRAWWFEHCKDPNWKPGPDGYKPGNEPF